MGFEVGQHIFKVSEGIARIDSKSSTTYGGKTFDVFKIVPVISVPRIRQTVTSSVPVNQLGKVAKPLFTKEELIELLPVIAKPSGNNSDIWPRRNKEYERLLKDSSLESLVQVYRKAKRDDLSPEAEKSNAEKQIFEEASSLLSYLTAYACDIDVPTAAYLIEQIAKGEITAEVALNNVEKIEIPVVDFSQEAPIETAVAETTPDPVIEPVIAEESKPQAVIETITPPSIFKIDDSKIDFSLPNAVQRYETAKAFFSDKPKKLSLYVIAELYKEEFRKAALIEYREGYGLKKASVDVGKSQIRSLFSELVSEAGIVFGHTEMAEPEPETPTQISLREAWDKGIIQHPMSLIILSGNILIADGDPEKVEKSTPLISKNRQLLLNVAGKPVTIATMQQAFEYVSSLDWHDYAAKNLYGTGRRTAEDIYADVTAGFYEMIKPAA